ncbi:MAG: YciI family protein [Rhodospirillales bacterium]|nr:YciI family protein [Rhodospirillales bacterium]
MLFLIYCIDRPGSAEARAAAMQPHIDYLATGPIKIVMSGPLTSDDGGTVIGSLYLVEAANRAEVEKFQNNDPLVAADIWETIEVRAFNKRIDNR